MAEQERQRGDRVNIGASVIPVYKELTENQSAEDSPCKTMKDVFMWAACFGYQRGNRQELPLGEKTSIRLEVFSESDYTILKAIALGSTGGVDVLGEAGDILTIAEEYAQAGIYDLRAQLLDQGGRPLWNLIDVIRDSIESMGQLPI